MIKQLFIAVGLVTIGVSSMACTETVAVRRPVVPVVTETVTVPGAFVATPVIQERVVVAPVVPTVVVKKPVIKEVVVIH